MSTKPHHRRTDKFYFACHAGLACFNSCCQDISIYLTPYDVLRLKNNLKITSAEFLTNYTHILEGNGENFPMVMLKMNEKDKKCPFVTPQGCAVYQDRPWSCRIAPVDILDDDYYSFCFKSSHCHGLKEQAEWTVQQWADHQGVDLTQQVEQTFKDIPNKLQFTGFTSLDSHIKQLFLLACYNLDEFKRYVFDSNFVQTFAVPAATVSQIKNDELALMEFAFAWLASGVDIRSTITLRDEVFGA